MLDFQIHSGCFSFIIYYCVFSYVVIDVPLVVETCITGSSDCKHSFLAGGKFMEAEGLGEAKL